MRVNMSSYIGSKKGISEALSVFIPIVLFMLFLVVFIFAAQFISFANNSDETKLSSHISPDVFTLSSLLRLSVPFHSNSEISITLYDLLASGTETDYIHEIYSHFGVFIARGENIRGFFQEGEGYAAESVLYTVFVIDRACAADNTVNSLQLGMVATVPQFYSIASDLTSSVWVANAIGLSGTAQYGGRVEIEGRCVLLFRHRYTL